MRIYRVNALDISDTIMFARKFKCRDDLDALAECERSSDHHATEVWDGDRFVARVKQGNASLNSRDSRSL